jgi:hypothetical protein
MYNDIVDAVAGYVTRYHGVLAVHSPVGLGRAVIQGKVISIKSNDFGTSKDGWKVFGTLASSISGVERRQAVEFGGVPLLVA